VEGLLQALSESSIAATLRGSMVLYAIINAAHIIAIGLVVGSLATLDLRLLGLFRSYPVGVLGPPLSRMAATGVALALITGFLLFSVRPTQYVQNPAFLTKIALVLLGILNALVLHFGTQWKHVLRANAITWRVRLAAVLSLLIWISAILAGRWIGFLE
jgi:hypothetical protein